MVKAIKEDIKDQASGYVTAALGLVAGLAWNDAIKSLIEAVFPFAATGIFAKFLYAIIITLVVVFISRSLLRTSPPVPAVKK
jgi:polyferredoxin